MNTNLAPSRPVGGRLLRAVPPPGRGQPGPEEPGRGGGGGGGRGGVTTGGPGRSHPLPPPPSERRGGAGGLHRQQHDGGGGGGRRQPPHPYPHVRISGMSTPSSALEGRNRFSQTLPFIPKSVGTRGEPKSNRDFEHLRLVYTVFP